MRASGATGLMCSTAGPSPIWRSPTMFWRSAPTARSISSSRARPTAPVADVSAAALPQAGCSASIPQGGPVTVRPGRFGPYVNHGKLNATLPKGLDPDDHRSRRGACASRREGGRGRRREAERRQGARRRKACVPKSTTPKKRTAKNVARKTATSKSTGAQERGAGKGSGHSIGKVAPASVQGFAEARLSSSAASLRCRRGSWGDAAVQCRVPRVR